MGIGVTIEPTENGKFIVRHVEYGVFGLDSWEDAVATAKTWMGMVDARGLGAYPELSTPEGIERVLSFASKSELRKLARFAAQLAVDCKKAGAVSTGRGQRSRGTK